MELTYNHGDRKMNFEEISSHNFKNLESTIYYPFDYELDRNLIKKYLSTTIEYSFSADLLGNDEVDDSFWSEGHLFPRSLNERIIPEDAVLILTGNIAIDDFKTNLSAVGYRLEKLAQEGMKRTIIYTQKSDERDIRTGNFFFKCFDEQLQDQTFSEYATSGESTFHDSNIQNMFQYHMSRISLPYEIKKANPLKLLELYGVGELVSANLGMDMLK